ncbi:pectate lyase family protein [Horticoccus sp. 23ND18S-11]|uniref:pectate lyase family protein n=1 Tax=Horticoccus sp. 23ND18S-11 TaxID=3391832 RepID=UPI0039C941D1
MTHPGLVRSQLACALFLVASFCGGRAVTSAAVPDAKAFPGAVGFGTETPGGRGGRVIKVTNLNPSGPGSLADAVRMKGPRLVVFEVGGVIDLNASVLKITEPFLTIAGQTAPSPGISIIRGGVGISTHDVVIQHIRVRAGDVGRAKKSGWEVDSMATTSAWNVVVDHCSLAWGTDENLSASGPRFDGGANVDAWRSRTSHDVTFSHCIIAEGLSNSAHAKGEHSKGSLIHDNAQRISIIGNLYASNVERNPLFKGGVQGVIVNNLIDNPGRKALHYGLIASEWTGHGYVNGQMAAVGNVLHCGPDSKDGMALVMVGGDGPLELFLADNLTRDRAGKPVEPFVITTKDSKTVGVKLLAASPVWPAGLKALAAADVKESVLKNAGARPWDRDEVDQRIVRQVREGKGRIIDSQEQVGGYPRPAMTQRTLTVPTTGVDAWLATFSSGATK